VPALFALAPGILALGATRPLGAYLLRLNRPVRMTAITVGAVVLNITACLVLIPRWGVIGCALACSLGYLALAGGQLTWFVHAVGIPSTRLLPGRAELARARAVVTRVRPARSRPAAD
jgi:O-antigen/teichoic acid export membrane protein